MLWAVILTVVALVLVLTKHLWRRDSVTAQELERRRRQLGIHDGKGHSFLDRG